MRKPYTWGYHSSDSQFVHVREVDETTKSLFDVALYDRDVVDEATGLDCEEQSLRDLRELIGYANAAITAGLDPEPVPDKQEDDAAPEPERVDGGIGDVGPRGCDHWLEYNPDTGPTPRPDRALAGYCIRRRGHPGVHSLTLSDEEA